MTDSTYIHKLYTKTHDLIHKDGYTPGTRDYKLRVAPNIAALRAIAQESTDETFKVTLIDCINSIHEKTALLKTQPSTKMTKTIDEGKMRLEQELLGFSKKLRQRVGDFQSSLQKDDVVLDDASKKMQANYETANLGLKKMAEIGKDISVLRTLFYAFIVFITMYFIIRFL